MRDTSITPTVEETAELGRKGLALRRSKLEERAVELAPDALEALGTIVRNEDEKAPARISAARVLLEQAVGRPNVREQEAVAAGTVVQVVINQLAPAPGQPSQIPVTVEARVIERKVDDA